MKSIRYGTGCLALFVLAITMGSSPSAAQDGVTAKAVEVIKDGADPTSKTPPLVIDEPEYVTFAEAFGLESDVFSDGARAGSRRSAGKARKGKCASKHKKTKDIQDAGPGTPSPDTPVPVSDPITCEVQYDNTGSLGGGPFPTTNVWMNTSYPAGLQVLSYLHPFGATCFESPGRIDCNLPNVQAFAIETVEMTLVSDSPINLLIDFLVSQFEFDPDPSDNQISIPFEFFTPGTISGTKFDDKNGNGAKDPGEPGVPEFEILINDQSIGSTDENGEYSFPYLPTGSYTVGENPSSLPGWVPSGPTTRTAPVIGGATTTDIDFGNYVPSDIIIWKFHDLNGNGVRDDGEEFLQDWEFWIDTNDDGVMDAGETAVTTDGSGGADFNGLAPGAYVVRENIASQSGWATSEARKEVTVESGQTIVSETAPEVYFANYHPGKITVFKFYDSDGDGLKGEGDTPIQDWSVSVDGTTMLTDAEGKAEFDGLASGTHLVSEEDRTHWVMTSPGSLPVEVELTSGGEESVTFLNYETGDIVVKKFYDKNDNGVFDDGEAVEGWKMTVNGDEKETDSNGEAKFEDLPLGTYTIEEEERDGWKITVGTNPKMEELESGENLPETPQIVIFGNRGTGKITVFKFHDKDADGASNGADVPLAGWDFTVDGVKKTTDANGEAVFDGLPPDTYTVTESKMANWELSTPNPQTVILAAGGEETVDFGNYVPGSISGTKYKDENGNGLVDGAGDVPLPNWTITCSGGPSCTPNQVKQTDGAGNYTFGPLDPGNYTITETVKGGWTATTPTSLGPIAIISVDDGTNKITKQDFHNQPTGSGDGADLGDAPEEEDPQRPQFPTGYPTTLANAGAVHVIDPGVRIGDLIDAELDGQPTIPADGDDEGIPLDDEDGIAFVTDFVLLSLKLDPDSDDETVVPGQVRGTSGEIVVYPSTTGILDAWVDWNRDGDWADVGEQIYDGEIVAPLSDTLDWAVPGDADVGYTYARFRFSLDGTDSFSGPEPIGEVEDYLLYTIAEEELNSADDTEDVNPGDGLCADFAGNCTVRAAIMETNATGVPWLVSASTLAKSGMAKLTPQSPYPPITGSLILDGAGTLEIDGSQAGVGANGFVLQSGGSWIVSTLLHSFDGDAIRIEGSNNVVFNASLRDNGGAGVNVVSGSGNSIRTNAIMDNGGLGIDLGDDDVTDNDLDDTDVGANGLQNYPQIGVVTAENGHIGGNLTSAPDSEFTIDFFVNTMCDGSDYGEGATFLVSETVTTNNLGTVEFNVSVANDVIQIGNAITATATGPDGSTSEFSGCFFAVTTDIERNPEVEIPNDYELFQNYPNPFNPVTNIRFAITNREWVTVDVYDILGKRVATLVNGWVDAGEFTVEFDATDLPSGIYLYRMTAGSFTTAKQLTLLK